MSDLITPVDFNRVPCLDKRQHLPYIITSECPECGLSMTIDLRHDHLTHPRPGMVEHVNFYHESMNGAHEWQVPVVVGLTLRLVRDE